MQFNEFKHFYITGYLTYIWQIFSTKKSNWIRKILKKKKKIFRGIPLCPLHEKVLYLVYITNKCGRLNTRM